MGTGITATQDMWSSGAKYEPYVGRWSRLVAYDFVDWLEVRPGSRWLDVGCGTGALTDAIVQRATPDSVLGVDPSPAFLAHATHRITDDRATFVPGDAEDLHLPAGSFDAAVAGLVLNFLPDWDRGVAEMARVVRPGGVVAGYVWDYAGEMWMMRHYWNAVLALDPAARTLHEGHRFGGCRPVALAALLTSAGLSAVEVRAIVVATDFTGFEDFWTPFLGGQGPAPSYLRSLDEAHQTQLRDAVRRRLPVDPDGHVRLTARAWAVRGTV